MTPKFAIRTGMLSVFVLYAYLGHLVSHALRAWLAG